MPKISVIVPVYKVEPYLDRCIQSILNQTYKDFELILIDDGSPDNCPAMCDEYAKQDSRIHVIHQENGGLSAARNAGIDWVFENSDSEWITFIDSDDWVHNTFLEKLYSSAISTNTFISICGFRKTATFEPYELTDSAPIVLSTEFAYVEHYSLCISACFKLYKKDLFTNIRFPIGKLHEDAFVTHLILFKNQTVAIINENLYTYYYNSSSITNSKWRSQRLDEIEAHELRLRYLFNKELSKPFCRELKAYILCITFQLKQIIVDNESNSTYLRILRKKLKRILKTAKKFINIDKDNYTYVYEVAFPKLMWFYWKRKAVAKKAKQLYHHNKDK